MEIEIRVEGRGEDGKEMTMKTMKSKSWRRAIVLALCAQTLGSSAWAQQIETNPQFTFDKAAYEKDMRQAFESKVMGYATVLIKNGQVVSEVAGGLARNAVDGNVKMTTSIPIHVGSTIKFVSGVALLQLFEAKTDGPRGRSMDYWLSQPIYPYFPKIWQSGMDPSIKQITFRHLLQHRSGFRGLTDDELGDDGKKSTFDYLATGVRPANFDARKYANANFTMLTFLIPMVADSKLLAMVNKEAADKKWKADEAPIHKRIADAWEAYIKGQIFAKNIPKLTPSCNPTVEFVNQKKTWAPDYKSATDTGKGATRDSRVNNGYCHAAGGWYITARDLAAFAANVSATNTLVSSKTRDMMFDDDAANERLVWSFTLSDAAISKKFNLEMLPYMGGDYEGGNGGGSHASILMLPDGYYAIGIINSNDMGSGGVSAGMLRAFKTSIGLP
jgi:CubicO group peptidase (beta-lactamase class C family)